VEGTTLFQKGGGGMIEDSIMRFIQAHHIDIHCSFIHKMC